MRPEVPIETDDKGYEHHPSFAVVGVHRVFGTTTLFDSDVEHRDFIELHIAHAVRKRELNQDWIHSQGKDVVRVRMSMAQWGAIVSSPNQGSGQPATLVWLDGQVPSAPHESRMAVSIQEVKDTGKKAVAGLLRRLEEVEEIAGSERLSKKKLKEAIHDLRCAIENAPSNFSFAEKQLAEHVENVVKGAEADIEMAVVRKAQQLGIDPVQLGVFAAELPGVSSSAPALEAKSSEVIQTTAKDQKTFKSKKKSKKEKKK